MSSFPFSRAILTAKSLRLSLLLGVTSKHVNGLDLFNEIEGLATLISCCDKVITIENLNAYLAGGSNVPIRVLLPVGHEWS